MTGDPHPGAAGPVASPCTGVCRIDADRGLCAGCLRTLDEIAAWSTLDDAARRALRDDLARRGEGGTRPALVTQGQGHP